MVPMVTTAITLEQALSKLKQTAMDHGSDSNQFRKAEAEFTQLLNSADKDDIDSAIEFVKNNRIEDYCPIKLIELMECR